MNAALRSFRRLWRDQAGATMVEYGLLIGIVSLGALLGAVAMGQGLSTIFNGVGTAVSGFTVPPLPTA